MTMVHTTEGLIERGRLIASDIVSEEDNARVIATEWHLEGKLVRRDVAVSILHGHALCGEQAEL
jgi:hypothetical protein